MPQLVKGGKWVFGWVMVGSRMEVQIPPDAFEEYGFKTGDKVFLLRGSRSSGGFGIGRAEKLSKARVPLQRSSFASVTVGKGGEVVLPVQAGVRPGDRLLSVRGSGMALGFIQYGPIYEEALIHPEIETW